METISGKIGVGITTYNSESYFQKLYDSIAESNIDELVVVNGGNPYKQSYTRCNAWIQDEKNRFPSACRNSCIEYLLENGCEHIFLIEDDMIIKKPDIFQFYIKHSKMSGLKYLCFASTSAYAGPPGDRTPKLIVNYSHNLGISFFPHMCNEFTYHHRSCFEEYGVYDENLRDLFDVDMVYRQSISNSNVSAFWWFADPTNSDDYIENNPVAVSRLQTARADGSRADIIHKAYEYFYKKHKLNVLDISEKTDTDLIKFLKRIKP